MITLRTKTEKSNLLNTYTRTTESAKVYMKLRIEAMQPNIRVSGEYYFLDAQGRYNHLSDFKRRTYSYVDFAQIQTQLPALESNVDVIDNFKQRCFEMVKVVIDQEAAAGEVLNFGITSGDELEIFQ